MVLLLYFRPFDNSEFALNLRGLFFIENREETRVLMTWTTRSTNSNT